MIESIAIENFKSIDKLDLKLRRVTVLIGENGSGKSNLLEAITLAGATVANKLDNEFLVSRGIRVTSPHLMRSAFAGASSREKIALSLRGEEALDIELEHNGRPYANWTTTKSPSDSSSSAKGFVIYSPENSALRTFERENQIQPLGIKGEGLFKLLKVMHHSNPDQIELIKRNLKLIDWFDDFHIPEDLYANEARINIVDRFLSPEAGLSQQGANEGFLFLLFYLTLFISEETPPFFAIDNIEASLNPKLCTHLMSLLVDLAKTHEKQVVLTTHHPAILDGINLDDEAVGVWVISRNRKGNTQAKPLRKPRLGEGEQPVKLSEAFLGGMLGGLPKGF